jgi:CRP-like cAMP-binding protein
LNAFLALGIEPPDSMLSLFTRKRVSKGDFLLRAGELWRHAIAVEEGFLRMYFIRKDGREFNKNFHFEGSLVLPITPAMQSAPSLFYIAAVEASTVWTAPATAVATELQRHNLKHTVENYLLSQLITAKLTREHDLLMLDAKDRYRKVCAEYPQVIRRVPLGMLATFLGITDVSLSRIRRNDK